VHAAFRPRLCSSEVMDTVRDYVRKIAFALDVKGILNIQMAYKDGEVYVLEANPRSSRTIPFVSKTVGHCLLPRLQQA